MKAYGLVEAGDAKTGGLGVMTDARWAEFFKIAASQGVFAKDLDVRKAYDLQFVGPKAP
jgi:NitT/TauT family transport system substrate-binding protein